MKYVRIKPYDGKKHVRRTYTCFGIKFLEARGWYKVDDDVAEYLRTVTQIETDPDSTPAFDIVDNEAAAKNLLRVEEARKKAKVQAKLNPEEALHVQRRVASGSVRANASAGDLTTDDLPKPSGPRIRKGDGFDDQDETFPEDGKPMNVRGSVPTPKVMVDGADGTEDEVDPEDGAKASTPPVDAPAVSDASGLPLRRHRAKTAPPAAKAKR